MFLEIRQLQDTRNELTETTHQQRKLNEAAVQAELDLKTKQIEKKLQVDGCYHPPIPSQLACGVCRISVSHPMATSPIGVG